MHTLRASTAKPGYKECICCGAYIYVGGIGSGIYPVSPFKNDDLIQEVAG